MWLQYPFGHIPPMTWPAGNSSTSFIIFGATNPTDQFGHQVLKFIDSSEVATWDPFYKMGIRRHNIGHMSRVQGFQNSPCGNWNLEAVLRKVSWGWRGKIGCESKTAQWHWITKPPLLIWIRSSRVHIPPYLIPANFSLFSTDWWRHKSITTKRPSQQMQATPTQINSSLLWWTGLRHL